MPGHGTSFLHRLPERSSKDHYSRSSSKTFLSQSSSFTRRYAARSAVLANIDDLLEGLRNKSTPVKLHPTENSEEHVVIIRADQEGVDVLGRLNDQVGPPSVSRASGDTEGLPHNHLQHSFQLSINEPDEALD